MRKLGWHCHPANALNIFRSALHQRSDNHAFWWIVGKRQSSDWLHWVAGGSRAGDCGGHTMKAQLDCIAPFLNSETHLLWRSTVLWDAKNCARWTQQQKVITPLIQSLQAIRLFPVSASPLLSVTGGKDNNSNSCMCAERWGPRWSCTDCREFLLVAWYWSLLLRQGLPRARISIFPSALLHAVIYTVKSHLVSLCWISTLRLFSFGVCACQGKRFVTIPLLGQAAIVLLISHPLLLVGNYPRSRVSPASSSLRYPD